MIWCVSLLADWSGQNYNLLIKLWGNAIHRQHEVKRCEKINFSTEFSFPSCQLFLEIWKTSCSQLHSRLFYLSFISLTISLLLAHVSINATKFEQSFLAVSNQDVIFETFISVGPQNILHFPCHKISKSLENVVVIFWNYASFPFSYTRIHSLKTSYQLILQWILSMHTIILHSLCDSYSYFAVSVQAET